ncbi:fibronectin type III domain-containing protein [Pseudooceanicola sp. CBS1P-1]|uniref:Fibronectin type-III domain-containing protein n=1 Tax=Pseudooceanicola albus TaxID=2692189 RepID=A0A6L7GAQ6_9RHOB|nr:MULTISPECIES: fibronectin type III domain-containing protein [Pseudooceanicola]MBT9387014.1 fibronectin type III domain-containing protein [Pseudooceanicola endophyticus]MXN21145.1 hypothetical protein [Pseudooceanicola albus]
MSIRKGLLLAALLSSTALPVRADPVTGFVAMAYAASSATALYAGYIGSAALATAAIATTNFLGQTLLAQGLAYVAGKLTSKSSNPYASTLQNYAQPISYMQRGYGTVRAGGVFGFTGFMDNRRHYTILVAAHSTAGPVTQYLSDREVEIDAEGNVTTDAMAGYGNIRPFTGQTGQGADAVLRAAFPEITADFDFAQLSGAHLWAKRVKVSDLTTVYPDGDIWAYAPVWKMNDQILDPRDGTAKWTDNLALCFAHEIVHYLGAGVDWDEVAEEAEACDVLVTNAEGATQRKWTFNRSYTDDAAWDDICAEVIAAGDCFVYERPDGKVGFKVGRWIDPEVTLEAGDFLSLTLEAGADLGANSQYTITYVEPLNSYQETPSGVWVQDDTAKRVASEVQVYPINSHNQASRINKRRALVEHAEWALSGTIKLIGFELIGQRFFRMVHPEFGLDVLFEIGKLQINEDGMTFDIEARSVTASDFEFDAATEEPERPAYEQVQSDDSVADQTGFSGAVLSISNGAAAITWSWDAADDSLHQQVRIMSSDAGVEWQTYTFTEGQMSWVATGLVDGAQYLAQVRNQTGAGRVGAWFPEVPVSVTAVAYTTAPGALSGFDVVADGSDVALSWSAPNDANYFATRIWRASYDAATTPDFADASAIHVEYGTASVTDAYTDPGPGAGAHYYWAEAINASGVAGPRAGPLDLIFS